MAARRLKFKPKPLIGLVRRNKDANDKVNSPVTNEDLRDDCNQSPCSKDESDKVSENLSIKEETDKIDEVGLFKENPEYCKVPGKEPISLPEPVLEEVINSNDSNSSSNVCVDNSSQIKDQCSISNLKSDINNKIRTVILNSRISSESIENSDNCVLSNKTESHGNKETGTVPYGSCDNENNFTSGPEQNTSCARFPGSEVKEISSIDPNRSSLLPYSVIHDKACVYDSSDNDKKKSSVAATKISTKFGKTRFKPVLSNVVRKKDSANFEELLESPANNLKTNPVEEIPLLHENQVIEKKQAVEKQAIDNCKPVEECPISTEKESTVVIEPVLPIETRKEKEVEKQPDVLPPDEIENELPARSPVKLFQPKKRQRSQGALLTNLTYKAQQDFKDKFKDGNIDKSKLMMRDLIFYNPKTNPMPERPNFMKTKKEFLKTENNSNSIIDDKLEEERVDDINDEKSQSSMPVPQVKVGPDGKIVLDPKSLVIEATGIQKGRATLENSEVVQENEFSYTKYHKRRVHRSEWSAEETLLFYKALNDLGADFSLMQSLFPKKTRRDLKLKFKKEERINSHLIDKAMRSSGNFDFTSLENELKKDREERERKLEEQRMIKEHKKKERLEKKLLLEKDKERKLEEQKMMKECKEKERLEKKAHKERKLEELKMFKEFKQKERLEKKALKESSSKSQTKRKNASGGGEIKKAKQKEIINRILTFKMNIKEDFEENNTVRKKPRRRKMKKQNLYDEESADEENNLFDACVNSSSDDGIVSDFIDEDNENNLSSSAASLYPQIFKKTRSGRQPKLKLLVEDSQVSDHINHPSKKLKMDKQIRNVDAAKSSALNIALSEIAKEFSESDDNIVIMSEEEIQKMFEKRFEKCYRLFEEPLDLSNSNLRNASISDDDNSIDSSNDQCDRFENNSGSEEMVQEVTLPIINGVGNSEIINTAFSSGSDLNHVIRKERHISESLQIMEELTSSEDVETRISSENANCNQINFGVVVLPSNEEYILPGNICEERDYNEETDQSDSQLSENSNHIIYSLNDNQIIENPYETQQNVCIGRPPIIFSNLQSFPSSSSFSLNSGPQIQVIPQEQINYIFRPSPNTVTDACFENLSKEVDSNEPISHSKIHCYPSSDHTYTSLIPKPVEQKHTYLIVTQMDAQDINEPLHSTVVVYPSTSDHVAL